MLPNRLVFSRLVRWLLPLLGLLSSALAAQEILSPESFVQAVVSRHPSLLKAEELVRAAEFASKASGVQPNPQLTLAVVAGDPGEDANSLTQNLEISGQPALRRSIANYHLEASQYELKSTRKQVIGQAYRAWLDLWRAHRMVEVAQLRQTVIDEMVRVARRRFEVGEISENEALRVQLASVQARTDLIKADAEYRAAGHGAALLLGREADGFSANPTDLNELLDEVSMESMLSAAADHPELKAQWLKLSAFELGAELIKKERAPTLGLSLYQSSFLNNQAVQRGAQLSVSWPILDWGSIRHRTQQQLAQAQAFRAEVEESLLNSQRGLVTAWEQLQAAKQNRNLLAGQAERYQELAREAKIAYDVGLWSLTDVLQTEQSYRQAGIELITANYEVLDLEIRILERTGLYFPGENP